MAAAAAVPLITAGLQAAGVGVSAASQGRLNKKMRQHNREMYARQRADALTDWHMQAEYNSPLKQMERLKEAGLNPNLVYGNGADAQMSQGVRSSDSGSWNPRASEFPLGSIMGSYQDAQVKQAQTNNLAIQKTVLTEEAKLKASQTLQVLANTDLTKQTTGQNAQLFQYQLDAAKNNVLQGLANIDKTQADTEKTKADTQFTTAQNKRAEEMQAYSISQVVENILNSQQGRSESKQRILSMITDNFIKQEELKLRKMGINPNDPTYLRILTKMFMNEKGEIQLPAADGIKYNFEQAKQNFLRNLKEQGKILKKIAEKFSPY